MVGYCNAYWVSTSYHSISMGIKNGLFPRYVAPRPAVTGWHHTLHTCEDLLRNQHEVICGDLTVGDTVPSYDIHSQIAMENPPMLLRTVWPIYFD
jgi:hypothetical protein